MWIRDMFRLGDACNWAAKAQKWAGRGKLTTCCLEKATWGSVGLTEEGKSGQGPKLLCIHL